MPTDLITVMVGTHDIIELFDSVKSSALLKEAAVAEIERRGALLGTQINRLTNKSDSLGRVMYSTVPRVSLTPYGLSKSSEDQTLLRLLTDSFNRSLRSKVRIDGKSLGFLDTSQQFTNVVDAVNDNDDVDSITNVTGPVCPSVSILACNQATLASGATSISHLWAGDINFSYAGHILIGDDAVDLARRLPW